MWSSISASFTNRVKAGNGRCFAEDRGGAAGFAGIEGRPASNRHASGIYRRMTCRGPSVHISGSLTDAKYGSILPL